MISRQSTSALAVGVARYFQMSPEIQTAALFAVILGHNWPFQLRFHGGKGVAVSIGALLLYNGWIPILLGLVFLPLWWLTRRVTLGGMLSFALAPLLVFLCGLGPLETFAMSVTSLLVVFAHRKNIREELGGILSSRSERQTACHPPEQHTS